eukprot:568271-Amphidinium_carterae.2
MNKLLIGLARTLVQGVVKVTDVKIATGAAAKAMCRIVACLKVCKVRKIDKRPRFGEITEVALIARKIGI